MTQDKEWWIAAAGLVPGDQIHMRGRWWTVVERGDIGEGVTLVVQGDSGVRYPCDHPLRPTATVRARPKGERTVGDMTEEAVRREAIGLVRRALGGSIVGE